MTIKIINGDNHNEYVLCNKGREVIIRVDSSLSENKLIELFGVSIENITSDFYCYRFYESDNDFDIKYIYFHAYNGRGNLSVSYFIDPTSWSYPFTLNQFAEDLPHRATKEITVKHSFDEETFDIDFYIEIDSGCVNDILESFKKKVKNILDESILMLTKGSSENTFTKFFNFPVEYRVICCQYLLWFGEFLENLGIQVDVSTSNNENGQTAILITSNADHNLRSEIENLFYKYLSLPYREFIPISNGEGCSVNMMAYHALISQVDYFKSQIALKDSIIQFKEASLGVLINQIASLKEEKKLLIDHLQDDGDIKIFNGSIKIGDFKWLGITVSPKRLIERFTNK